MSENPRRGRQARNFTTNVPKILDLKSSSEQIFFRKLSLGAPDESKNKPCTEVRDIEFISIQPCQFFVFTFCHSSSNSVSIPVYFVSQLHSLPSHLLICLLQVICFKFPITRTFFDFPRRFELSGVVCNMRQRTGRATETFQHRVDVPFFLAPIT